ncbi:hypothetical protein [Actinoplanes teichomyceticus]|uniref:Uncharacterized protein n=1 Tax=Actinoplanes teichomyceticus TaxID=1867 RepID=A0A561VM29_ACTTI|nr:hypothetical protein [Actinoplanes teichomyceticus]TWG12642.1 hypothetical protein FHX34_105509 [Actinoplanes teichomyceticus]GIF13374.1 hypothetical protein Ate01nite_34060 [Actinoplanes teichomyceticus]
MLTVAVLLMGFSLAAAVFGQPHLATIAGTACVALSSRLAHRLLPGRSARR